MSMLSAQCDELRSMAESVGLVMPRAATLMMEAADTITELRGALQVASVDYRHLQDENAKLRELVQTLVHCLNDVDCDKCPLNGNPYELRGEWAACDVLLDRMRELGVEVNG